MISIFSQYRKSTTTICLLALIVMLLAATGCTQATTQQQKEPVPVTATQVDNSKILISYPGSTATVNILELEATVTDSAGKTQTKSVGDRYSTTPLKFGATLNLEGSFSGNDRLFVTGYYMDGSQKRLLETTL